MCTVCGCGEGNLTIDGSSHHPHPEHRHEHEPHHHGDGHGETLHYGQGPAHAHAPGLSQSRMVRIEQDILAKNGAYAEANRRRFDELGLFALNLVSSPGSGKTSLLTASIRALQSRMPVAVIEGDQQTQNDAARIRDTGARAVQVNTGKGCHLDAHMVGHALDHLMPLQDAVLMIENVGNLVCPAGFDLGEAHKVAVLSVTEGEDKPLKYPDMFHAADLMLLNKVDLLPHLDFDVALCIDYARRINPDLTVIQLSATTGEGMEAWLDWVAAGWQQAVTRRRESVAALKRRIVELEARLEAAGLSPGAA